MINPLKQITTYIELHCASAFSFLRSGSSVEALVARAEEIGMPALALTDYMTLAGVPRFQTACAAQGLQGIVGAELAVADPVFGDQATPSQLVVLVRHQQGYSNLCRLLTDANLARPEHPTIPIRALAEHSDGLVVLTGGRSGLLSRLLLSRHQQEAERAAEHYLTLFGADRIWLELQHHRLPDSIWLMQQLVWIAEPLQIRLVATNQVHYATPQQYPIYDILTCTRLGVTVDTSHAERPRNDEAYLKSAEDLATLFDPLPWGKVALAATYEIAAGCTLSLLRPVCVAPHVALPPGKTPIAHLRSLCDQGLITRYTSQLSQQTQSNPKLQSGGQWPRERHGALSDLSEVLSPDSRHRRQLAHELDVIEQLDLAEFFLCVHDIVTAAKSLTIRCSGRGSAANSLVAYVLGITGTDPIQHRLLFERFLNPDRRGMPDIDLDIQSDRRAEVIRYVEQTYAGHAAMVANVSTYRPRSALRDVTKALGFPLPVVNRLTKVLPPFGGVELLHPIDQHLREELIKVMRTRLPAGPLQQRCLSRLELALQLAKDLLGLPRHLSLHNGGMVLTREPLDQVLPIRISANGVRALEVDKEDVEGLGLIKFDLLGLRTLGAVEEALALVEETTGQRPDVDHLPLDDAATFRLIRAGQTIAVFQVESPGQWHLLAQTQPQTFDDLIVQVALFRPGPLQANMVHPYVERRQQQQEPQRDAVQTPWHGTPADDFWTAHQVLGPILHDSEGILLFQEQILEIAHDFAGLSYAEADGFRRAMSHQRSQEEMEQMRLRFVGGAIARGESQENAERVFTAIGYFVGYGLCKSHAAEFSRIIYQTAWLKAHYPAQYLAAFLSSQPAGFFPPHVVLEEAKLLGIPVLPVDINRSEDRFSVEQVGIPGRERWAIRIGLRQIAQVGDDVARAVLWARRGTTKSTNENTGNTDSGGEVGSKMSLREHERPFCSLQEFCERLRPLGLTWPAAEALVLSGACDRIWPPMSRRQRLWQLHELWSLVSAAHSGHHRGKRHAVVDRRVGAKERRLEETQQPPEQLTLTWKLPPPDHSVLPALPALDRYAYLQMEYDVMGLSSGPHLLRLKRGMLRRQGLQTIAEIAKCPEGRIVRVAGLVVSAQRPPTAKGMGFLVLEDETGRLPVAVSPRLAIDLHRTLQQGPVMVVVGHVERIRWYRSLGAIALYAMPGN